MNDQIIFTKGQKVTVIKSGSNASEFTMADKLDPMGVYSISSWYKKIFEIEGTVKLVSFKHEPLIYGAYLLKLNGVNVGYVYSDSISSEIPKKHMSFIDTLTEIANDTDCPNHIRKFALDAIIENE